MGNRPRLFRVALVPIFLLVALRVDPATAAPACAGLPASTLEVLDIKASAVEEVRVSVAELEQQSPVEQLASRHTLMMSANDIVAWFDIVHRTVPGEDGVICDAPTLVRMGFGSSRRFAFLESSAAQDRCVHLQMLGHEESHARALNDAVDRFIDQHRDIFGRGMAALKETPASSMEDAKTHWEIGLRLILDEAKHQLVDELRSASARIDNPSAMAVLENACGGKIRQLEEDRQRNP